MILAIKGRHNSGKTAFIERIIKSLPNLEIVVMKLSGQNAVDIEEKDTYRYRKAGAYASIIITTTETAFFFEGSDIQKTISLVQRLKPDLIIIEGYKRVDATHYDMIIDIEKKQDINHVLREIRIAVGEKHRYIGVAVDGVEIVLNDFVKDILHSTIKGMLSTLRGCEGNQVEIILKN